MCVYIICFNKVCLNIFSWNFFIFLFGLCKYVREYGNENNGIKIKFCLSFFIWIEGIVLLLL